MASRADIVKWWLASLAKNPTLAKYMEMSRAAKAASIKPTTIDVIGPSSAPVISAKYYPGDLTLEFYIPVLWPTAMEFVLKQRGWGGYGEKELRSLIKDHQELPREVRKIYNQMRARYNDQPNPAEELVERIKKRITPDAVASALGAGLKMFITQAYESVLDDLQEETGRGTRRDAKRLKSAAGRIGARHLSVFTQTKRGRREGSKNQSPRCSYSKIEKAILELYQQEKDLPRRIAVARKVGFKGSNPAQTLSNWLSSHRQQVLELGHSSHNYRTIAQEIIKGASKNK